MNCPKKLAAIILALVFCDATGMNNHLKNPYTLSSPGSSSNQGNEHDDDYDEFLKEVSAHEDNLEEDCLRELRELTIGIYDPQAHYRGRKHQHSENKMYQHKPNHSGEHQSIKDNQHRIKRRATEENHKEPGSKIVCTRVPRQSSHSKLVSKLVITPRDKTAFAEQQVIETQKRVQEAEKQYKKSLDAFTQNDIYQITLKRNRANEILEKTERIFINSQITISKLNDRKKYVTQVAQELSNEIVTLTQQITDEQQKPVEQQDNHIAVYCIAMLQDQLKEKKQSHERCIERAQIVDLDLQEAINKQQQASDGYEKAQKEFTHLANKINYLLSCSEDKALYDRLLEAAQRADANRERIADELKQHQALYQAFKKRENQDKENIGQEMVRTIKPLSDLSPNIVRSYSPGRSSRLMFFPS